jgi:hypothetical protein
MSVTVSVGRNNIKVSRELPCPENNIKLSGSRDSVQDILVRFHRAPVQRCFHRARASVPVVLIVQY